MELGIYLDVAEINFLSSVMLTPLRRHTSQRTILLAETSNLAIYGIFSISRPGKILVYSVWRMLQ
jgi:hypothetical protein